jgi:hypothetical protein
MARGTVIGEPVVSQAGTPEFREGHSRTFGESKPQRGRWVWDEQRGCLVDASEYRAPARALNAPIIADRIHEGTTFHDGERVRDLGSRRKRREFLRETGLADATDYSKGCLEGKYRETERHYDRRIESSAEQAARKLYHQGKMRD